MKKFILILAICFSVTASASVKFHHINDGEWYLFTDKESACFSVDFNPFVLNTFTGSFLIGLRGVIAGASNVYDTGIVYATVKINGITVDNNIVCPNNGRKDCQFFFSGDRMLIPQYTNKFSQSYINSKSSMRLIHSVQICLLNLDVRKSDPNTKYSHLIEASINMVLPNQISD